MILVIDFLVAKRIPPVLKKFSGQSTLFILAPNKVSLDEVNEFLDGLHLQATTFSVPEERQAASAWKANTAKALHADLFLDSDLSTADQARLLGVNAAFYRL